MDAKALGKRIKLQGLQRLRWYCQMCEKQCRDDNGFKNHCTTEGHLRQMEKFSSSSHQFVEQFSKEFEKSFCDVLSRMATKRINANYVYNQVIQDKSHVHMNSTKWDSLGSFVRYLGETGKCEVERDESENKWLLTWIDPERKLREEKEEEKRYLESKRIERLRAQMEEESRALLLSSSSSPPGQKEEEEELTASVFIPSHTTAPSKRIPQEKSSTPALSIFSDAKSVQAPGEDAVEVSSSPAAPLSTPNWFFPEIVVRLVSKKLGKENVNEKAIVSTVYGHGGDLILLKSGQELFNVDCNRVETVIPKVGCTVRVVNPASSIRGSCGKLIVVDAELVQVQFETGNVVSFKMEDVCKIFED